MRFAGRIRVIEFHLLEEVGRGNRSRVFLCRQAGVGDRQVIVKFTHGSPVEADVLGRLRHPNIVPVHFAVEQSGGLSYICMPFLGRSTLADFIEFSASGAITPRELLASSASCHNRPTDAVSTEFTTDSPPPLHTREECVAWIGWKLALALSHAHEQGIVHGDVKPSNVLLSVGGSPLLVDFNLSGSAFHSTHARGGTLPYMPPEQLQSFAGASADAVYDKRSDLYSLGVLLFEAITGRLPFPVEQPERDRKELACRLFDGQRCGAPDLQSIDRRIPRSVAAAIERCLAFSPAERIQSADELAEIFGDEFGARRRIAKIVRRHWLAASFASTLLVTGVGVSTAFALSRPPEHERLYQEGAAMFRVGNFNEAARIFDRGVMLAPNSSASRFNLGRSLLRANELTKATDCFLELHHREKSARAAAYIAYCLSLQGKMDKAASWYVESLKYSIASPEVHNNIAVAYDFAHKTGLLESEQAMAANKHLRIAESLLPDSPTLSYNRLRLELRLAESIGTIITAQTAQIAESLAATCPDHLLVQVNCARIFVQRIPLDRRRIDDAIKCLGRAVSLGYRFPEDVAEWRPLHSHSGWSKVLDQARSSPPALAGAPPLPRFLEPVSLIGEEADIALH
jgi:serine/threonine protein kinase